MVQDATYSLVQAHVNGVHWGCPRGCLKVSSHSKALTFASCLLLANPCSAMIFSLTGHKQPVSHRASYNPDPTAQFLFSLVIKNPVPGPESCRTPGVPLSWQHCSVVSARPGSQPPGCWSRARCVALGKLVLLPSNSTGSCLSGLFTTQEGLVCITHFCFNGFCSSLWYCLFLPHTEQKNQHHAEQKNQEFKVAELVMGDLWKVCYRYVVL